MWLYGYFSYDYETQVLKTHFFEVFFFLLIFLWFFVFMIVTLEIFLPNHTWNIILSSKPCFVIIKININQILVSQYCLLKIYLDYRELLIQACWQQRDDSKWWIKKTIFFKEEITEVRERIFWNTLEFLSTLASST